MSEDIREPFRTRVGTLLRKMRMAKGVSIETASKQTDQCINSLRNIEAGKSANPKVVEKYEEQYGDEVLLFLASDHPHDCAGSLEAIEAAAAKVKQLESEVASLKLENGKLYGIMSRWQRILQHYNLWSMAMPKGSTFQIPAQYQQRPKPYLPEQRPKVQTQPPAQRPVSSAVALSSDVNAHMMAVSDDVESLMNETGG